MGKEIREHKLDKYLSCRFKKIQGSLQTGKEEMASASSTPYNSSRLCPKPENKRKNSDLEPSIEI